MDRKTLQRNKIQVTTILIGLIGYLIAYVKFTITQIKLKPEVELEIKEYLLLNLDLIFECSIYALIIFTILSFVQKGRLRRYNKIYYIIYNFKSFIFFTIGFVYMSTFFYMSVPYL